MSELSKLEYALLCAARAFAACYQGETMIVDTKAPEKKKNEPTSDSNGIPECHVHGKAMKISKFNENEYYCGAKLDNGKLCREKAWVK